MNNLAKSVYNWISSNFTVRRTRSHNYVIILSTATATIYIYNDIIEYYTHTAYMIGDRQDEGILNYYDPQLFDKIKKIIRG